MVKVFITIITLSGGLVFNGCAGAIIALGAGVGAYSYVQGKLVRSYRAGYYKAVGASKSVLQDLRITVTERNTDALKTVIKGNRADGTPVTIEVKRLDPNITQVGVRNGVVGIWNRDASEQIHEFLRKKLKINPKSSLTATTSPSSTTDLYSKQVTNSETPKNIVSPFTNNTVYIYYQINEIGIPTRAFNLLDRVVDFIKDEPDADITIRGYTDSSGSEHYNLMISKKRADAVKNYLVSKGVRPAIITTIGLGAKNFIAGNKTEKLRSLNRRIELEFSPHKSNRIR